MRLTHCAAHRVDIKMTKIRTTPSVPRSRRHLLRAAAPAATPPPARMSAPPLPSLEVLAMNRMGFGPSVADRARYRLLGSSEEGRFTAYVEEQLAPGGLDDAACDTRLAALTTLTKSLSQLWDDHVMADPPWQERIRPYTETQAAAFIRAIYSRRQLKEVLADFWHNHFSVYGNDYRQGPVFVHYDRDVIRPHVLGNFRTMVEAVAASPAMLFYLDNRTNSGGNPNENYARELFELHTLGAEHYLGVLPQGQVPVDPQGRPVGYVDEDVYGATTCFTGWTVNMDSGQFEYDAGDHFPYQKFVLGTIIPANQVPLKDGRDVLDLLAYHPGTAEHIARKLCRRLIADDPPASVIAAAAQSFVTHATAPDQMKHVVETILLSNAFRTTWGEKIKRPFEVATSALRAVGGDFTYTDGFRWYYELAGQPLFRWPAPNGFPDTRLAWATTMSLLQRWRLTNRMIEGLDGCAIDILAESPPGLTSPNQLTDYWIDRVLGRPMEHNHRGEILEFIAQGRNADQPLPADQIEERLPRMVGLILLTPDFQWR